MASTSASASFRRGDLVGLTVHVAARVGVGRAEEVLITSAVNEFVDGSGLQFTQKATERPKGGPNLEPLRPPQLTPPAPS